MIVPRVGLLLSAHCFSFENILVITPDVTNWCNAEPLRGFVVYILVAETMQLRSPAFESGISPERKIFEAAT